MKLKIVTFFILYCAKNFVNPRNFFQIHAKFFNEKKGIFSKLDLESHIPEKWRLQSSKLDFSLSLEEIEKEHSYPFIGKPEWGQNAHGVRLVQSKKDLENFLGDIKNSEVSYVIQNYSSLDKEFEISYTKDTDGNIRVWSIVESINIDSTLINSIHGRTKYKEILDEFSDADLEKIKGILGELNDFKIARVGIKANSVQDLTSGNIQIFEINIFIPLPLYLLAENITVVEKDTFLRKYTKNMVLLTKNREKRQYKEVFFRKIFLHYRIKIAQNSFYLTCKRKIYSWIEDTFMDGCSDYNSIEVRRASRSKKQARDMFKKLSVPHAHGEVFINPFRAHRFVKKYGFPVVIKPNVGGYSRGSYFPIENYKDLWKAIFLAKLWWPTSVVETYLLGKNYRVVVTKGSVDIAMQRTPATIIGNGQNTISELIDVENTIREELKLTPIIHLIEKSHAIKKHIGKSGYSFSSVLESGKKIELYHRVSLAPGGVLYTISTDTISKKNKDLFKMILDSFGANIFGIDVIMEKGIETDFDKQKTIFLELNSRPYLKMHTVPREGKGPDMNPLHKKLSAIEISGKGLF